MEQNNFEQQVSTPMPPKPDNNLVLAIICTICCCLPLGIVGIVKASKVNGLYYAKQYEAANLAAQEAKKWSLIGIGVGLVINIIYWLVYGATIFAMLGMLAFQANCKKQVHIFINSYSSTQFTVQLQSKQLLVLA